MERNTEFFEIYKPSGKIKILEAQVKNSFRKIGGRNAVITIEINYKSVEYNYTIRMFTKSDIDPLKVRKTKRTKKIGEAVECMDIWIEEYEKKEKMRMLL